MNLNEIKAKLNIETLALNTSTDAQGVKDPEWMRHWDNESRMAISIPTEIVNKLKADPTINTLALQTESKTGAKGEYTAHRIVMYPPAEITL